ncbi:MAG: family 16 glycoside hydrolase [Spirosomataceae bacterium]
MSLFNNSLSHARAFIGLCWLSATAIAQGYEPASVKEPLSDLSFFKSTGKANWQIVGNVNADLSKNEILLTQPGTGVLVNLPDKDNRANLQSAKEYGDVDVEFEFMMATHSNSGFYLMGRYEVQLLDSWGVKSPRYGDCGGIYRRRRLPDGYEYEGHAPRLNACKAPGLWQKMRISFQAPRFDASGKKIQNGKFLNVTLNGVTIQENVEVTGPTGGPISEQEAATGPFMIQGDHGAVAFRNMKVRTISQATPLVSSLRYTYYLGPYNRAKDIVGKKITAEGTTNDLTWEILPEKNNYGLIYTGSFSVEEAGTYAFTVSAGGSTHLKINGQEMLKDGWTVPSSEGRTASVALKQGVNTFELGYFKTDNWLAPALGLFIEGDKLRKSPLHIPSSLTLENPINPILIEAKDVTLLRSFMDYQSPLPSTKAKRIVHAISVGYPDDVHYTIDLDNGAMVQVWRGGFLNATPMWMDRGDGSSQPLGSLTRLNDFPLLGTATLTDTLGTDAQFKFKGYDVNAKNEPTFKYSLYGSAVEDEIRTDEASKYFVRELRLTNPAANLQCRLAEGANIEAVSDDTFAINNKSYFIKVLEGGKASVVQQGNRAQLLLPASSKIRFAILF